ncbi:MAG TPA: Fe-Mn family superoxide dismutase [Bacillota bacterium]|nr:Fe-Mn family superoxide dismutase [Bacillota bacterium]
MTTQKTLNDYVREIEQWTETAEKNWNEAKRVFTEQISDEELIQWETSLQKIIDQIEQLKKPTQERATKVDDIEIINEQCQSLYEQYTRFHRLVYSETPLTNNESHPKELANEKEDKIRSEKSNNYGKQWGASSNSIPPGEHRLPPLPYDYAALEPYIKREIMQLHHKKHHQSYVDGLNKAEKKMVEARKTGNFELIRHWEREAAFNGAGHYLHTIFWNVMSPRGGGNPKGALLQQIKKDFGSYRAFKKHFSEAAKNVEGVGWSILVWAPRAHRLTILQAEKHQILSQWDVIPILVLDVWEHAYYLQYKTNKDKYVDNWWNVVNWDHVTKRFEEASKLRWKPY